MRTEAAHNTKAERFSDLCAESARTPPTRRSMPAMTRTHTMILALALAAVAPWPTPAVAGHARATGAPAARTRYHFDDIPVRSALQVLAEDGDVNLVVSDSVTGNVSLHLEDVTWEQALAVVLRLKGLDMRVLGDSRVVGVR